MEATVNYELSVIDVTDSNSDSTPMETNNGTTT